MRYTQLLRSSTGELRANAKVDEQLDLLCASLKLIPINPTSFRILVPMADLGLTTAWDSTATKTIDTVSHRLHGDVSRPDDV